MHVLHLAGFLGGGTLVGLSEPGEPVVGQVPGRRALRAGSKQARTLDPVVEQVSGEPRKREAHTQRPDRAGGQRANVSEGSSPKASR
jgi:hypothetical protein